MVSLYKKSSFLLFSETTESLASLIENLKPRFTEIQLLYKVYDQGIVAFKDESEISCKASGLLAAIYNAFVECDNKGSQKHLVSSFSCFHSIL